MLELIEEFRKLYSNLDFFSKSMTHLQETVREVHKNDYEAKLEFQKKCKTFESSLTKFNPSFPNGEVYMQLIYQYVEKLEAYPDKSDLKNYSENFVLPVMYGFIRLGIQNPQILELLLQIKFINNSYEEMVNNNLHVENEFMLFHKSWTIQLEKFIVVSKRLIDYQGN
jgi:hypothetical protein